MLATRIRSISLSGSPSPSASSTAAPAIIVDGLPENPAREPRAAVSESVAAPKAARADLDGVVAGARGDRRPADQPVVLELVEDVHLVASERLGAVHRVVRVADQGLQVEVAAVAAGDAGRQARRRLVAVVEGHRQPTDQPAELLGQRGGRVDVGLGQDQQELLATVAAHEIDRPDVLAERVGDPSQDQVAGGVAVRVVEPLEVVEVDHHDRQLVAEAGRPIDLGLERGQDRLAIEHAGQVVDRGQRPDLGHAIGQLGEARAKVRIVDPVGPGQVAGVGRRGELVQQPRHPARLPADDRQRRNPVAPRIAAANRMPIAR